MIQIAIVDDDAGFTSSYRKIVENFFIENDVKYEIHYYTSAIKFKEITSNLSFDLIFLDIDMPEITGFDIAIYLGEIQSEASIIFVSSHSHLVFQSIHYRPFRFLQKDHLLLQTREAVEAFCQLMKEDENSITLLLEDGSRSIEKLRRIQFFYSLRHNVVFSCQWSERVYTFAQSQLFLRSIGKRIVGKRLYSDTQKLSCKLSLYLFYTRRKC